VLGEPEHQYYCHSSLTVMLSIDLAGGRPRTGPVERVLKVTAGMRTSDVVQVGRSVTARIAVKGDHWPCPGRAACCMVELGARAMASSSKSLAKGFPMRPRSSRVPCAAAGAVAAVIQLTAPCAPSSQALD
jgi:hypothetical protein